MASLRRYEFEELPPGIAAALAPRVKRLGYLGEFFKCAAHQPEALGAFIAYTESCKRGLPNNLVEVIALTCAVWMGNDYERNQHEQLCLNLGFTRDWVAAVLARQPERASALSVDECALQHLVLKILVSNGAGARALFSDAVTRFGEAEAIAILMVVGRYVTHALIVNTLGLAPPVPSIFAESAAT